jgi:hypothetical protein
LGKKKKSKKKKKKSATFRARESHTQEQNPNKANRKTASGMRSINSQTPESKGPPKQLGKRRATSAITNYHRTSNDRPKNHLSPSANKRKLHSDNQTTNIKRRPSDDDHGSAEENKNILHETWVF